MAPECSQRTAVTINCSVIIDLLVHLAKSFKPSKRIQETFELANFKGLFRIALKINEDQSVQCIFSLWKAFHLWKSKEEESKSLIEEEADMWTKGLLPYPGYSVLLYHLVLTGEQVSKISLEFHTYSHSLFPSALLIHAAEINFSNIILIGNAPSWSHPKCKAHFAYKKKKKKGEK